MRKNEYKRGTKIVVNNKMQKDYSYVLEKNIGEIDDPDFNPFFTPEQMLYYGVFEGKYLNDSRDEFPIEWYENAEKVGSLSTDGKPHIECNFFNIKSRLSLGEWRKNGWIPQTPDDPDNRGWFQWYCRYYIGRRIPDLDKIQIKRYRAFNRHFAQVQKNCAHSKDDNHTHDKGSTCDVLKCRPKQRQALLQWGYNAFI